MIRTIIGTLIAGLGLLIARPAETATLQAVSNWGATGVPSTVSMYIYVPDKMATNPPILVLAHYCGGSASAVFGQASGIAKAADQYGFIMVVPQAVDSAGKGRCWDVGTTKSLTHDGGGDTQAIAQMVKYTITKYQANADRVYATGDSSGGMMTEALLAVYPDVFKGGAAFAGVPAGCWAVGASSDGTWSNQCAGGSVTFTAQQWGDKVRAMDATYSGHRGRVQLFHGDADGTINYKNHTEAIKEWTNVLGLDTNPTSTDTGLTLGTHQATRQRWKNACGYVVLEAWTSINGDHGPSDCLFNNNVVPFLGLDKTGAVDPEIEQCGAGGAGGSTGTGGTGAGGSGGSAGSGGNSGTGGSTGGRDGGADARRDVGSGGTAGSGGASASGGSGGSAGASGSGGNATGGGSSGSGGAIGSGGRQVTGGSNSGGSSGSGGTTASGGVTASGGSASGGSAGQGAGGASSTGGTGGTSTSGGTTAGGSSGSTGCACSLGSAAKLRVHLDAGLGLFLAAFALIRRRRKKPGDGFAPGQSTRQSGAQRS